MQLLVLLCLHERNGCNCYLGCDIFEYMCSQVISFPDKFTSPQTANRWHAIPGFGPGLVSIYRCTLFLKSQHGRKGTSLTLTAGHPEWWQLSQRPDKRGDISRVSLLASTVGGCDSEKKPRSSANWEGQCGERLLEESQPVAGTGESFFFLFRDHFLSAGRWFAEQALPSLAKHFCHTCKPRSWPDRYNESMLCAANSCTTMKPEPLWACYAPSFHS